MIRIKNTHTKEVLRFRTQKEAAAHLKCSTGAMANLVHGRTKLFGNWKLHNYPLTKPHLRLL